MNRLMKILTFICLAWVMISGLRIGAVLPADAGEYVEKKYAGWSGVLRGWIYSDWQCAGSFVSWLNAAAAEFEKAHDGVYIEFEQVTKEALLAGDIHPPDMRIRSGITGDAIALGGYVFAENPSAAGTMILPEHCGALIAMYEEKQIEMEDSGMELGLPVMSRQSQIIISEDAFREFCNGNVGRTIVNQQQLAKLITLRENGRGPDWQLRAQGNYSWQDQVLRLSVCAEDEEGDLCRAFLELLLSEEIQGKLSSIGAFSATGISIYSEGSAYREMEKQLLGTVAIFPKDEHSPRAMGDLVRKLASGEITAPEAAGMLTQTYS